MPADPLAELASGVGNRAFGAAIARSAAGVLPGGRVHPDVEEAIARERGGGVPLDARALPPDVRGEFADVRIHADAGAAALARAVAARAFTTGTDVYFAAGEYRPGTSEGDELLAHELAHVAQQRGGSASGPLTVSQPGDPLEAEADATAAELLAPGSARTGAAVARRAGSREVQRKILVDGIWYGKGDDVTPLNGRNDLPAWTKVQLESEDAYVLNADRSAWVLDTQLLFMRFRDGRNKVGSGKTGASSPDPFADVRFSDTGKTRVGPKHPETRMVSKARLFKYSTERAGHWMLQCDVEGGKQKKNMKIDLTEAGYRVMYGAAAQTPTSTQEEIEFDLEAPRSLRRVYESFVAIAKTRGKWTGTDDYNCQDFALAMLGELKVGEDEQESLEKEAKWREEQKAA